MIDKEKQKLKTNAASCSSHIINCDTKYGSSAKPWNLLYEVKPMEKLTTLCKSRSNKINLIQSMLTPLGRPYFRFNVKPHV